MNLSPSLPDATAPSADVDEHGIDLKTSDDVWIVDCRMARVSGDSIQIGGQDPAGPTDSNRIYVGGVVGDNNRQNNH